MPLSDSAFTFAATVSGVPANHRAVDPAMPLSEAGADRHCFRLRQLLAGQRFFIRVRHGHTDPVVGAPAQAIVLHLLRMVGLVHCAAIKLHCFAEIGAEHAEKNRPAFCAALISPASRVATRMSVGYGLE